MMVLIPIKHLRIILFLFFLAKYILTQSDDAAEVDELCLGCLCEAISGCNATKFCDGVYCGPFRVTWPYWAEAGKPTVNGESKESETAYRNCATDFYCSAAMVQNYMAKFKTDCNGDGKIDCDDYVAIQKLGRYRCGGSLPDIYLARYHQCKRIVEGADFSLPSNAENN